MVWIYLIIASLGEILGVMSINMYLKTKSFIWILSVVCTMGIGFLFLSLTMKELELSTAYAIWTGLGATGAVITGILFFNEKSDISRLFFLSLIISGAIGLKLIS